MIQVHGEAFCMFHPAYDASCLSHKKHQVVLQKHCTVEVSLPENPSDQDPVVHFSSLYALLLQTAFIIAEMCRISEFLCAGSSSLWLLM